MPPSASADHAPPSQPAEAPSRVPAVAIAALITDAFKAVGLPDDDAAKVAELMTEADLTGADAHGVFRLPQYVKRIQEGGINVRPHIRVNKTAPGTALVDGDNGMGHLVMARTAETAIELACDAGVGWAGARRSNHAGAAGVYAAMPLAHDMIGLYAAVSSANHMAPWGGIDLLLGTNPLAAAIPAGDEAPFVLDIATSVVSYGTVKNHRLQDKPMPEGWVIGASDGKPVTDPKRMDGLLLPIGGYKGSGLAILIGLLAGVLNGAAVGRDVVDFNADAKTEANTGQFVVAIDIRRFIPLEVFKAEVDRHLRDLRASRPLPQFDTIRLPGQQRQQRRQHRVAHGIPIVPELMAQLDKLAEELGVKPLAKRT
jgi:LDH2 family malate/lactate/ureidoglycolate dehydrogenase